jgi:hypothetical protein
MKIDVSNGEFIDKVTILEIKLLKITDRVKLENIRKEYDLLNKSAGEVMDRSDPLYVRLREVNLKLWDVEDRIRDLERKQEFGREFVETARMVYFTNDLRAKIKHDINIRTGSEIVEEKSYEDY